MMQDNGSCYSNIQGCSAAPILRNINKKVTYFTLLHWKTSSLQNKDTAMHAIKFNKLSRALIYLTFSSRKLINKHMMNNTSLPRRNAVLLLKGCWFTATALSVISTPQISQSFSWNWIELKLRQLVMEP